jgi:RNA recognition motif-containing protein
MSNDRLYVGNLSFDSDENTVRNAFAQYGDVRDVKLITDRDTGRPRGFGFVTMGNDAEAAAAIEGMDGQTLDGRALRVNVAEERGGGGGGRGGNRGGGRGGRY